MSQQPSTAYSSADLARAKALTQRFRRILRLVIDAGPTTGDLHGVAAQIAREELSAQSVVRKLISLTGTHLIDFAAQPQCGVSVLRRLLQHLDKRAGRLSLDRFLELATAGVTIAQRVAPAASSLCVKAWQKQGTAYARKGRFGEAGRAFDTAQSQIALTNAPEYYFALVMLARASAAYQERRPDKAGSLLPGLAEIFERYSDERHTRNARELHAIILQYFDKLDDALAEYKALGPLVKANGTRYEVAIFEKNIATCLIDRGELEAAATYLTRAIPVLKTAGQHDAIARVERKFARRSQDHEELKRVALKFYGAGALGEYVITYLDALTVRLTLDPTADVAAECRILVEEAVACGLERHVAVGLLELERLAQRREITSSRLTSVRDLIALQAESIRTRAN